MHRWREILFGLGLPVVGLGFYLNVRYDNWLELAGRGLSLGAALLMAPCVSHWLNRRRR